MAPNVASAKPPINPEDPKYGNLTNLRKDQLKERLTDAGILYNADFKNPQLRALCALSQQGIISRGDTPDPELFKTVIQWVEMPVSNLVAELKKKKLDTSGHKWDHIEELISDKIDHGQPAVRKLNLADSPSTFFVEKPNQPNPTVVNLVVAAIHAHIAKYGLKLLPGCPIKSDKDILQHLDTLPDFQTDADLEACLAPQSVKSGQLLSWICKTYGDRIAPASDDLLVPGFSEDVLQFVHKTPDKQQHQNFFGEMEKASLESILLFHGTPLSNLHSILTDGFKPSKDTRFGAGNFMAEEPLTSYWFAAKETYFLHLANSRKMQKQKNKSGLSSYGVLFGCQVAGKGRPKDDGMPGGVHVITNLHSIAIRYIFLIPYDELVNRSGGRAPARAIIKDTMTAAFKTFPDA